MENRIQKLKDFLSKDPTDLFLNHALALEYIKQGNTQAALEHFLKNLQTESGYVATYYHLGKLYELIKQPQNAIETYENGMVIAKKNNDMHSYNELQAAYEDLIDE